MPKADPLVAAAIPEGYEQTPFDTMRLQAMLTPPTDPLHVENNDLMWADYGRRLYNNINNEERFLKAITTALVVADGQQKPQEIILSRVTTYLHTGTIR